MDEIDRGIILKLFCYVCIFEWHFLNTGVYIYPSPMKIRREQKNKKSKTIQILGCYKNISLHYFYLIKKCD